MAKRTSTHNEIKASPEQIYYLHSRNIKVYPVKRNGLWYVQTDNYGKITTFEKSILEHEINESIAKTIIHYYKKLTENKNGNK